MRFIKTLSTTDMLDPMLKVYSVTKKSIRTEALMTILHLNLELHDHVPTIIQLSSRSTTTTTKMGVIKQTPPVSQMNVVLDF
jgi:hypothetical protein